jgi:hypothetical protein
MNLNQKGDATVEQRVTEKPESEGISDEALDQAPSRHASRQINSLEPIMGPEKRHYVAPCYMCRRQR